MKRSVLIFAILIVAALGITTVYAQEAPPDENGQEAPFGRDGEERPDGRRGRLPESLEAYADQLDEALADLLGMTVEELEAAQETYASDA